MDKKSKEDPKLIEQLKEVDARMKKEKVAHTPGPWMFAEPKDSMSGEWEIIDEVSASMLIATLNEGENDEEFLGNALLISSAPDLLKTAKKLLDTMVTYEKFNKLLPNELDSYREDLRQIIKYAEGK